MKRCEKALLYIIGRALFSSSVDVTIDFDVNDLYKEACNQAVAILVWQALTAEEKSMLSNEISEKWKKRALAQSVSNLRLIVEQENILKLLFDNHIPCAILKGSSVACNYPDPILRVMGDIDILVPPDLQNRAVEILQSDGYGDVLEDKHHCHYTISKGRVVAEIHEEPNGIHLVADERVAEKLHSYFEKAIDNTVFLGGVPSLSTEYQAVVLLLHKLEHFLSGGLGLRQLCDWACFVEKHFHDEEYYSIRPILSEFGMLEFTGVITRVCCDWLHLPVSCAKWCMDYDEGLAAEVIEEIVSSGNFGRKNLMYGQRVFEDYSSANRVSSALKTICESSKKHWRPCEKYPILMPIGIVINIFRYLKLRIKGKRPDIHPIKLYQMSGAKQKLYKSLKPFQKTE